VRADLSPPCPNPNAGHGKRRLTALRDGRRLLAPGRGNTVRCSGEEEGRVLCLSPHLHLHFRYCVWSQLLAGRIPIDITITARVSLLLMSPKWGKFPILLLSLSAWLHSVRHYWVFPIHVPLETRHVAGLGLFGSDAAHDYRWLSRAWTDSGNPPQPVLSTRP
jgi:hypothetical protein